MPQNSMFNRFPFRINHSRISVKWERHLAIVAICQMLFLPESGYTNDTNEPDLGNVRVSIESENGRFNIFQEGEKPYIKLVAENPTTNEKSLEWSISGKDMWSRQVCALEGNETLKPGEKIKKKIELPLNENWRGFLSCTVDVTSDGKTDAKTISIGLIPKSGRKFGRKSPFGAQTFVWEYRSDEILDAISWAGAHWLRWDIAMEDLKHVPRTPGAFEWWVRRHKNRDIEMIPIDVRSYPAGTFIYTEAGNEDNLRMQAPEYAEQMKLYYLEQRKHDPNVLIGSAGFAGIDISWLEEFAENGGWEYLDILNVHLHCFPFAPEVDSTMTRYFWLASRVTKLRPLMEKYGERPVFDTEQGYLQFDPKLSIEGYSLGMISEEDIAAAYLVRSYLEAMALGLIGKSWFTFTGYSGFALIDPNTKSPHPSYVAYAVMTKMLDDASYVGELQAFAGPAGELAGTPLRTWFGAATEGQEKEIQRGDHGKLIEEEKSPGLPPRTYARIFRTSDYKPLLVVWSTLWGGPRFQTSRGLK